MKLWGKIEEIVIFLVWLGIGFLSIHGVIKLIQNPNLASSSIALVILLVVWSAIWFVGGIYGMRLARKYRREKQVFRENYHAPARLVLRDRLMRLRVGKRQIPWSLLMCCTAYFMSDHMRLMKYLFGGLFLCHVVTVYYTRFQLKRESS